MISKNTLLPSVKNYDLKFDSSASDHIPGIWAYTLALLETSIKFNGNHIKFIIFDEPKQQNTVEGDTILFLEKVYKLSNYAQFIISYTIEDDDSNISKYIKRKLESENIFYIENYAFKRSND